MPGPRLDDHDNLGLALATDSVRGRQDIALKTLNVGFVCVA